MIDFIVAVIAIWAFVSGLRRGLIVQLCYLVGLYIAILIAPSIAQPIGSLFMEDGLKAYLGGFIIIIASVLLLVWFVAPLLRKTISWQPARIADMLLGGTINLAATIIVIAALFSIFDRINVGPIVADKLVEIYAEGKNVQQKLEELNNGQGEMKEYTHHRYIDYLTLEESVCFEPLARFGDVVCPTLGRIDKSVKEDLVQAINRSKVIFVNNSQQSAEDSTPKHETTTAPQTPNTEQK